MSATDPLGEVYDENTLARIDRSRRASRRGLSETWRGSAAAGAIAGAALSGIGDALEPRDDADHVVEVRPEPVDHRLQAVTIHFVPHDPRATVAVIRPWLLASNA